MTNEELRTLANRSILLSAETRAAILENLETLTEDQKKDLEKLLVNAQKKQEEFLVTALKNNPNLFAKIKGEIQKVTVANIKSRESASTAKESQALGGIESEINNLFD